MKKRIMVFLATFLAAFFTVAGMTAYATFFDGPKVDSTFKNSVAGSSGTLYSFRKYADLIAKQGFEGSLKRIEAKTYYCHDKVTTLLNEYEASKSNHYQVDVRYDTGDANNLVVYGQVYNSDSSYAGVNNELLLVTTRLDATPISREYYKIYLA